MSGGRRVPNQVVIVRHRRRRIPLAALGEFLEASQKEELLQTRGNLDQVLEDRAIENALSHQEIGKMTFDKVSDELARIDVDYEQIRCRRRELCRKALQRHRQREFAEGMRTD